MPVGSLYSDGSFDTEPGPTVGGALLFPVTDAWRVGIGADFSFHSLSGLGDGARLDSVDGMIQVDWMLAGPEETARPYLGALAGYSQRSFKVVSSTTNDDGLLAGGVAGLIVPVRSLQMDLGLGSVFHSGTSGNGSRIFARFTAQFGLSVKPQRRADGLERW